MPKDNLQKVHEALTSQYDNIPPYDKFVRSMSDSSVRAKVHEALLKDYGNVPKDFEKFSTALGYSVKKKSGTEDSGDGSQVGVSESTEQVRPPFVEKTIYDLVPEIDQESQTEKEAVNELVSAALPEDGKIPGSDISVYDVGPYGSYYGFLKDRAEKQVKADDIERRKTDPVYQFIQGYKTMQEDGSQYGFSSENHFEEYRNFLEGYQSQMLGEDYKPEWELLNRIKDTEDQIKRLEGRTVPGPGGQDFLPESVQEQVQQKRDQLGQILDEYKQYTKQRDEQYSQQITDLERTLDKGVKKETRSVTTTGGTAPTTVEVPLTEQDKAQITAQIAALRDQRTQFFNPERAEVVQDVEQVINSENPQGESIADRFKKAGIDISDMDTQKKMNLYFNALWQEWKYLHRIYGREDGVERSAGDYVRDFVSEVVGMTVGGRGDEEKRYNELTQALKALAPIALINRNPVYDYPETAMEVFGKAFVTQLDPGTERFVEGTEQEKVQNVSKFFEVFPEAQMEVSPLTQEQIKEGGEGYEPFSTKDWAQMVGTVTGFMAPFAIGSATLNSTMRGEKIWRGLSILAERGSIPGATSKFLQLMGRRPGVAKIFFGAGRMGAEYEFTGELFENQSDEANFYSGLFGGGFGSAAQQAFVKIGRGIISKAFGDKADEAVAFLKKGLSQGGYLIGTAAGETTEEFTQETTQAVAEVGDDSFVNGLYQIWSNSDSADEFRYMMDQRFGETDDALHFAVQTFMMGLVFGGGSVIGQKMSQTSMEARNKLSAEDRARFDEIANETKNDLTNTAEGAINQSDDSRNEERVAGEERVREEPGRPVQEQGTGTGEADAGGTLQAQEPTEEGGIQQVEPQVVTTKSGKYRVFKEEGKTELTIETEDGTKLEHPRKKDFKSKDEYDKAVKRYRAKRDRAVKEYEQEFDYGQGEQAQPKEFSGLEEYYNRIADDSKNPLEIVEAYQQAKADLPSGLDALSFKDQIIATEIGQITRKDYERFGDPNKISFGMARAWLRSGRPMLDVLVESLSEQYGIEITPQDVIEFIDRFPKGYSPNKTKNATLTNLEDAFRNLTGMELKDSTIKAAEEYVDKLGYNPLLETDYSTEEEATQDYEDKIREYELWKLQNPEQAATDYQTYVEQQQAPVTDAEGGVVDEGAQEGEGGTEGVTEGAIEQEKPPEDIDDRITFGLGRNPDLSIPLDLAKSAINKVKEYSRARGNIPTKVFARKIDMDGKTASVLQQMAYTASDFRKALDKIYRNVSKQELVKIDGVLKGEADISTLPEGMRDIVTRMRDEVDVLSRRMIDEGIVEGDLQATIGENLGTYLTRAYQIHIDPQWSRKVSEKVRNRYKSWLRSEFPEYSEARIEGEINKLLYSPDTPIDVLSKSKLGSKDLGIVSKRKSLPEDLRRLLGEIRDPLYNYANSVTRMADLIEKQHFLNDVKQMGMGEFLFEEPNADHYVQIAAEGSSTMSPLNGLYTTPEIAEAFKDFDGSSNSGLFKMYMAINGTVKYGKTILSLQTHIRNFIGNIGFLMMNGHWRVNELPRAMMIAANNLSSADMKDYREAYKHYLELGVVQESSRGGEVRDIIKDIVGNDFDLEQVFSSRTRKLTKKTLKFVQNLYQAEDDVYKIMAFENEKARYRKAYPDKTESEIEGIAAEIVRNTYPTYSLVPKGVRALRKFPLVGTFVSFPAEVLRTTYNSIAQTKKELSDPATRGIGVQRLAGQMLAATATTGAVLAARAMLGIDREEDDALRRFVAPWTKNSQLLYLKKAPGSYEFVDLGYSDPHNYIKKPAFSLIMGDASDVESITESVKELFDPFLSEEILAERLLDVSRNKKKTGGEVYNEGDSPGDKAAKIVEHVAEALEPGTLRSFRRIWDGIHGNMTDYGRKYDPVTEVTALFTGQRIETVNILEAYKTKTYFSNRNTENALRIYTSKKGKPNSTEEDIEEARVKANAALGKAYQGMIEDYQAALSLGVPVKDARAAMRDANLTRAQIKGIMDGKPLQITERGDIRIFD